jgi:hypothetical protein
MARFRPQSDLDDATLLATATAEADRWQRLVDAGAAHQGSHKVAPSRKRKGSGGREVTMAERVRYAPAVERLDPPVSAFTVGSVRGMAIAYCLACGEDMRRHLDSDRPCPFCRGTHFAWRREQDTWIGEDYSLPAGWYGDLTGVSAHWLAVQALKHATQDRGVHTGQRSGQPRRVVPTGPSGTMRWLTSEVRSLAKTRSGRPRKDALRAYTEADAALFADGTTGHVGVQSNA